jgi:microcystin-dependent protein
MADAILGEIRILPYARTDISDWLPCDGRLVPISSYDALYALLGTQFGGDGVTSFALPDMRGRLPMGQGTLTNSDGSKGGTYALGNKGGAETVTLAGSQGGAHTHTLTATTAASTSNAPGPSLVLASNSSYSHYASPPATPSYNALAPEAIASAGGGQAHNNIMPSLGLQFFICTNGFYPTQS